MSMFITKSPGIFTPAHVRTIYNRCRIGNRDWVGFGHNGSANYKDDAHFPFPAIRFKENTRDIWALREKEKGDWKCLCCEEKKALYRSSFCQTFAEFQHPTGLWKVVLGCVLLCTSFSFWAMMFNHYYVFEPLPASLSKESQKAQLRRMLELRVNPIDGISSKWDYDNDRWKPGCEPCELLLTYSLPICSMGALYLLCLEATLIDIFFWGQRHSAELTRAIRYFVIRLIINIYFGLIPLQNTGTYILLKLRSSINSKMNWHIYYWMHHSPKEDQAL